MWCQKNNLSFNVNKTKEMIVDFRKQNRDRTAVEKVESFKFLGVHITDKLKWSIRATAPPQPQKAEEMCLVT